METMMKKKKELVYPPPLLSNDDVTKCPMLFLNYLKRFHSAIGTRFMIPVIGGKELDLHHLYVEVTDRGGLEKVIGGKKWREVINGFDFPPTTTSASFVLRKYYISLLHHFEQVYYFRLQGPLVTPAAILQTKSFNTASAEIGPPRGLPQTTQKLQLGPVINREELCSNSQNKGTETAAMEIEGEEEPMSFTMSGTIEEKFDHGYLITAKMGSETLNGVLYRNASSSKPDSSSVATNANAIVPYIGQQNHGKEGRKGKRKRDPNHPKPNRSAYNFYFANEHSRLKTVFPQREFEFSKMIGESWAKLSAEEKKVYNDIGLKDKERYRSEIQEYNQRLKLVPES